MGNTLIVTTDRSGLSLAQVGGNDIYKLLPQVQSVLEQGNLGTDYVHMFAEPVDNGRSIDWYVEGSDKVVPLADLDDAQRKELLNRFQEMIGKIQQHAKGLRNHTSDTYRTYADILEKALIVPSLDQALYSDNGKPVLVNWGFSKGDSEVVDGAQSLMKDIQDKLDSIKDMNELAKNLAEKAMPEPESTPAEPQPQPEPQSEPQPQNQPQPQTAAKPSGSGSWIAAAIVGALLLAAGAAAMWYFLYYNQDDNRASADSPSLAWLKGDLNVKGMLIDENNEAVDLTLRFAGEDGIGTSIIQSSTQTCTGQVVAKAESGNRVAFSMSELKCPNGHNYEPFTMVCVRGQNECAGTNRNGESWRLNVNI